MITAIETSVLIAIDQGESSAPQWVELLAAAREEGALIICDVVAAEFFAVVMDDAEFTIILSDLGIEISPTSRTAACHAGAIFRHYRDQKGPREHLIPDFLIASHAKVDCHRLASADRGYLRRYFPDLQLLTAS